MNFVLYDARWLTLIWQKQSISLILKCYRILSAFYRYQVFGISGPELELWDIPDPAVASEKFCFIGSLFVSRFLMINQWCRKEYFLDKIIFQTFCIDSECRKLLNLYLESQISWKCVLSKLNFIEATALYFCDKSSKSPPMLEKEACHHCGWIATA